jgi:hypothetical protein
MVASIQVLTHATVHSVFYQARKNEDFTEIFQFDCYRNHFQIYFGMLEYDRRDEFYIVLMSYLKKERVFVKIK